MKNGNRTRPRCVALRFDVLPTVRQLPQSSRLARPSPQRVPSACGGGRLTSALWAESRTRLHVGTPVPTPGGRAPGCRLSAQLSLTPGPTPALPSLQHPAPCLCQWGLRKPHSWADPTAWPFSFRLVSCLRVPRAPRCCKSPAFLLFRSGRTLSYVSSSRDSTAVRNAAVNTGCDSLRDETVFPFSVFPEGTGLGCRNFCF